MDPRLRGDDSLVNRLFLNDLRLSHQIRQYQHFFMSISLVSIKSIDFKKERRLFTASDPHVNKDQSGNQQGNNNANRHRFRPFSDVFIDIPAIG